MTSDASIHGFRFCPLVSIVGLPPEIDSRARGQFWYRRYEGPMVQEVRLLPSDVRLFHESRFTLGQDTDHVMACFGIGDERAFEDFLSKYLASGLSALTLWARSLRPFAAVQAGLDLQGVWLDKDSVIALAYGR